jgi:hypothetical protein
MQRQKNQSIILGTGSAPPGERPEAGIRVEGTRKTNLREEKR